jgi:hypothetical protein
MDTRMVVSLTLVGLLATVALAGGQPTEAWSSWMAVGEGLAAADAKAGSVAPPTDPPANPGTMVAPLAFHESGQRWLRHTLEGYGGTTYVPAAYLLNPGPEGTIIGMPAFSVTYLGGFTGSKKSILSFAASETLFRRIELSYAWNRIDMEGLRNTVRRVIANDIGHDTVYMHNWNIRGLILEEDSFGLPIPALTGGVHFKYNPTIKTINDQLLIPLNVVGYERTNGVEFTLTATKTIEIAPLPKIVVSVGLRNSDAAYTGHMGFSDHRSTTIETSAVVFPTDWLWLSYEFRRKEYPYSPIPVPGMVSSEDNWHGIGIGIKLCEHATLQGGVHFLGNVADEDGDGAVSLQLKVEL